MKRLVTFSAGLSLLFLLGTVPAIAKDTHNHDNDHRHYGWQRGWEQSNERAKEVRSDKSDHRITAPTVTTAPAPTVTVVDTTAVATTTTTTTAVSYTSPVAPDPLAIPR